MPGLTQVWPKCRLKPRAKELCVRELWRSLKIIKSTNGTSTIVRPMWCNPLGVFENLAASKVWTWVSPSFSLLARAPPHPQPHCASSSANSVSLLKLHSVEQWDTSIFSWSSTVWAETSLHRTIHSHAIINTSSFSIITILPLNRLWYQREHGKKHPYPRKAWQNTGTEAAKHSLHYFLPLKALVFTGTLTGLRWLIFLEELIFRQRHTSINHTYSMWVMKEKPEKKLCGPEEMQHVNRVKWAVSMECSYKTALRTFVC